MLARRRTQVLLVEEETFGIAFITYGAAMEHRIDTATGTAQQRAQPRLQFRDVERLGQIVVGAKIEVFNDVRQGVLRADDQHRRRIILAPQSLQHHLARYPRQGQIQQDRIVLLRQQQRARFFAAVCLFHGVPRLVQQALQPGRQFAVILNQQ